MPSATERLARRRSRAASTVERVHPLYFPAPPPTVLLKGFGVLSNLDGLLPWRPARFVAAVAAAGPRAQRAAALVLGFGDDVAWASVLRAAPPRVRRRVSRTVNFDDAAHAWRGGIANHARAREALLDAWDQASRRLDESSRDRNLARSRHWRFPHLWAAP